MRRSAPLFALLFVVVILSVASVRLDSATSDEPAHIANGVIRVTERWPGFFREQPPLMNSLSALPLVLSGYRVPPGWKGGNHWSVGQRFLYLSGYDPYRILFLARLPTIALFAALIAVMYWFVLRQTGSAGWALAAATLTGFCPNLMAHGRLATVDLAMTFFSFVATVLLIELITRPSMRVAVTFGVTAAAAVMSKVSGVILAPYLALVVGAAFALRKVQEPRRFLKGLAVAIVAAVLFFEAVSLAETGSDFVRAEYPDTPVLLVPFAEYLANIRTISAWYDKGHAHPQFLLGQFSREGWKHYYLVALLLKTSIPALVLFVAAAVIAVWKRSFVLTILLLFVVLFLVVAATGHLALGVRYVLPVYAFLYAAAVIAVGSVNPRRAGIVIVGVLVGWHVFENVVAYPSYLSYFNQFIGSHRNADRYLIDSNLDWGQDLRRLDRWLGEKKVDEVIVHYFGGGAPQFDVSARVIGSYGAGGKPLPKGSWFALSRHYYRLSFAPSISRENYDDYLARSGARYVATVGGSINVYRVE
ncbi:MAG: ArnT family glycosyltransferase [Thermoanaerobaculia bacterium]